MTSKFNTILLIVFIAIGLAACANTGKEQSSDAAKNSQQDSVASPQPIEAKATPAESTPNDATASDKKDTPNQNNAACLTLKHDDLAVDQKQTFAIDFAPFGKSCFVVFHDPEFDNPPMNSQYFIYKDGKEVFAFPEQFNGSNVGCWVDAVSFEDLNGDSLNDIAIAAKCSAKSKPYSENIVYINTGKDFRTNIDANEEMMDFTKMSQIKQYVHEHQALFSK